MKVLTPEMQVLMDYLRENKDYPYYLIKDRLSRAEADSVRELERDAGMPDHTIGPGLAAGSAGQCPRERPRLSGGKASLAWDVR